VYQEYPFYSRVEIESEDKSLQSNSTIIVPEIPPVALGHLGQHSIWAEPCHCYDEVTQGYSQYGNTVACWWSNGESHKS